MKTTIALPQVASLMLGFLTIAPAAADTCQILPDGTGDAPTIQAGINGAAPGDVLELADGWYMGNGNRDLNYGGKAITIRSQSGSSGFVLRGSIVLITRFLSCQAWTIPPGTAITYL